jgi:bacterioferritin-associated ferredoxin
MASDRLVCICSAVTAGEVRRAISHGARTFADLARVLDGVGTQCQVCHEALALLLDEAEKPGESATCPKKR